MRSRIEINEETTSSFIHEKDTLVQNSLYGQEILAEIVAKQNTKIEELTKENEKLKDELERAIEGKRLMPIPIPRPMNVSMPCDTIDRTIGCGYHCTLSKQESGCYQWKWKDEFSITYSSFRQAFILKMVNPKLELHYFPTKGAITSYNKKSGKATQIFSNLKVLRQSWTTNGHPQNRITAKVEHESEIGYISMENGLVVVVFHPETKERKKEVVIVCVEKPNLKIYLYKSLRTVIKHVEKSGSKLCYDSKFDV